jgi:hypothetical protein
MPLTPVLGRGQIAARGSDPPAPPKESSPPRELISQFGRVVLVKFCKIGHGYFRLVLQLSLYGTKIPLPTGTMSRPLLRFSFACDYGLFGSPPFSASSAWIASAAS